MRKRILTIIISLWVTLMFSSCTRTCPKYPMDAKAYLPMGLQEMTYESGEERMVFYCSDTYYNGGGGTTKRGEKYQCDASLGMTFTDSLENEIVYRNSFSSWDAKGWATHHLSIIVRGNEFHFLTENYDYLIDKNGDIASVWSAKKAERLMEWSSALGESYEEVYRVEEENGSDLYICENLGIVQIETKAGKVWTLRLSSVR